MVNTGKSRAKDVGEFCAPESQPELGKALTPWSPCWGRGQVDEFSSADLGRKDRLQGAHRSLVHGGPPMAGLGQRQKPPCPPRGSPDFGATVFILHPGGGMEFGWRSELSHAPAGQAVQGGGRPAAESPGIVAECVQEGQRSLAQERPEAASAGHAGPESPPNPPPASQECDSRAPSPAAGETRTDGQPRSR